MANIVVTGGAGFIGSHLVDRLVNDGHNVFVLDNLSTGLIDNLNGRCSFIPMDICEKSCWNSFNKKLNGKKIHFIYHLAAQINLRYSIEDPSYDAKVNIIGSLNVIDFAKNIMQNYFLPKSPYGISKLAAEYYIKASGLQYIIFRLSNVYGPRQNHKGEAGVISIFINNILENKDLLVFGDGKQTRDFIYVDDVVDALMIAIHTHNHLYMSTYNIATGKGTNINTIIQYIKDEMQTDVNVVLAPEIVGELKDSVLVPYFSYWKSKTSLPEGISKTIKYFKS